MSPEGLSVFQIELQISQPGGEVQKKILVGSGLSLTAVLLAAVLLRPSGGEGTGEGEASADPIPVITEVIQARDVHEIVSGVGTVLAFHDVTVSSETSGKVVEVYAEVGDRVEKGDPLVQVDDELRRSAVEAAEAQLMLAEANFQKAKRDLERSEGLFKTQDISEMELEGARLAAKSAEANYLQAKAALRTAQRRSKDTRIVSPISGQVALRHVDLGTAVAPGSPIATIIAIERVKVKLGVSEKEVAKLAPGQKAQVQVDAYPGRKFTGHVYTVGLKADMSTRTFPVEVIVANRGPEVLKPGMIARVDIEVGILKDAISVPQDAVMDDRGGKFAYVVQGDSAERRPLLLGPTFGEEVLVEKGLTPGDELVIQGQSKLRPGDRVERSEGLCARQVCERASAHDED